MKNLIKLASAVAVAFTLTQTVQAIPIVGNIGFTGGVTFNTNSAAYATQVTSWVTPVVTLDDGAFAGIASFSPAAFTSSIWNFNTSTAINSFWSVGGFTFKLLSSSIQSQGGVAGSTGFVVVNGIGTVTSTNPAYSATQISWSFTSQDPKVTSNPDAWTFSASANSVPDGGSTVMLLGLALSGAALIKRRLIS